MLRRLTHQMTGTVAVLTMLFGASSASAEPSLPIMVSPGITVSGSFGKKIEIGILIDLRVMGILTGDAIPCDETPRGGLGAYGQAGWYSKTGWRFGAGIQGGHEIGGQIFSMVAEFGWSYRRGGDEYRLIVPSLANEEEWPGFHRKASTLPRSHSLHFGAIAQALPTQLVTLGFQVPLGFDIPITGESRGPFGIAGTGLRIPPMFGFSRICSYEF